MELARSTMHPPAMVPPGRMPGPRSAGMLPAASISAKFLGRSRGFEQASGKGLEVFDGNGETLGAIGTGNVHAETTAFQI